MTELSVTIAEVRVLLLLVLTDESIRGEDSDDPISIGSSRKRNTKLTK